MKVMISTDMEGISGIVGFEQVMANGSHFQEARDYFTHDVNAAVQGCVDAGADEVLVTDNHAFQINLRYAELHPAAQLIVGGGIAHRRALVMEGLDESFDVALLVGYHAAAHYEGGIISHSYFLPAQFFELRINGVPVGETEIGAALAGAHGVPCGMISGDDVTIAEAVRFLPKIETVVVKWALDRYAARCLSLEKTGELIHDAAQRACERARAGEFEPWTFEPPLTLEIVCSNYGLANKLASVPGAEPTNRRVVAFQSDSYLKLYEALLTFCYVTVTGFEPAVG